ncbi:MAG: hypothetical protein EOP61_41670, partial [Sphingomonadales bacterium]
AQSRMTYISGARDDVYPEVFERPLPERVRGLFDATPRQVDIAVDGGAADPASVMARLRAVGIEQVLAVRLSDPALPFAVVKVLVPGLENPDGARRQRLGGRAVTRALFG